MEVLTVFRDCNWPAVLLIGGLSGVMVYVYLWGAGFIQDRPAQPTKTSDGDIRIRLLFCNVADVGFARAFYSSVKVYVGRGGDLSRVLGSYSADPDGGTRFVEGYLFQAARTGVPLVLLGAEEIPLEYLQLFGRIQRTGCVRVKGMPEGSGLMPLPGFEIVLVCERQSYNEDFARTLSTRLGFQASVAVFDSIRPSQVA